MKYIRIRSMQDIKLAKEIYRYEAKVHNQALNAGLFRLRSSFRDTMENTLRVAFENALIFGIKKLASRK
ncbi:MAG: hypothetical protein P1P82_05750 [Bacteroidales bacterium]|nr:hypothetical protein [Bacteroidales bacterium]